MATKIEIVEFTTITTTGTQDVTITGFGTPQAAIFFTAGTNVTGQGVYSDALTQFSAMDGSRQGNVSVADEDNVGTTDTARRHDDDFCLYINDKNGAAQAVATGTFITDGVRLDFGVLNNLSTGVKVSGIFINGATNVYVGWALVGNENVQTQITAPSFEPDLVIMSGAGFSSPDTDGTLAVFSLGFGVNDGSDTQKSISWTSVNGVGTSSIGSQVFSNRIASQTQVAGVDYTVEIDNFNSNGFDLYARDGNSGDYFLYVAIETELSVWAGSVDSPTSTGSDAQTGVGFQPDFLFQIMGMAQAEDSLETDGDAGPLAVAVMDGSLEQCWAIASEDNVSTTNTESGFDDVAVSFNADDGSAAFDASFTSFDSDGWTLNFSAVDGTVRKWVALALGTAEAEAGNPWYYYAQQ